MSNAVGKKKLVVVESPTKAKTIRKFLDKNFIVESCMGHIRDLPQSAKDIPEKFKKEKWAQLGVNVDKNFEPLYTIPKDKVKVVKNLKDKLEEVDELLLATDEDREGESISWHLMEVLKPKVPAKRMVFNEITQEAIRKAVKDTRPIDFNLVKAQEARRILDRLVGYTISPLLWKKVAYGLSAGRVQSVAVRLTTEREIERLRFKKSKYSGLTAYLEKDGTEFESRLHSVDGKRIATGKDFDSSTGKLSADKNVLLLSEQKASELASSLKNQPWKVSDVEDRPVFRKPAPPFITSTLQQEANRKLGLSSRETMQVAQKLYEQGFITYMRTDSTFLSKEAIDAARKSISSKYGKDFLPAEARFYDAKKAKGAQEAHEAIRPAGSSFVDPDDTGLNGTQFKLYDLIWKRTMASQMPDSRQKQVSAKIAVGENIFSASGMTIEFPGYLRAYVEGSDDPDADLQEREVKLPPMKVNEVVKCKKTEPTIHETKPPARYTEASLVQMMEKEGIGRPSTYASVIGTIIDRGYVRRTGTSLIPTFTAMVVSKLLSQHLPEYVDLGFTSEMEQSLDTIAEGDLDHEKYLKQIYFGPKGIKTLVESQEKKIDPDEARTIKLDGLENYAFHVGRYGAYVTTTRNGEKVSASIPDSESPADSTPESVEKLIDQKINGADALGKDPVSGLPVYALTGRYGPYVQLGDVSEENDKPKRQSVPAGVELDKITLQQALDLLALPKKLGTHPTSEKDIKVGIGRFGPYVVHEGDFRSIPKGESVFDITLGRAIELINQPKKGRGRAAPLKEFAKHPLLDEVIQLMNGPYGPYLKCKKINVSLPEGMKPEDLTEAQAIQLITEKGDLKEGKKGKSASKTTKTAKAGKQSGSSKADKSTFDADSANEKIVVKSTKVAASTSKVDTKSIKSAKTPTEKAKVLQVTKVITRKKGKK